MKHLLSFHFNALSISIMLTLLSAPVYAQTVSLSEKGYVGKWVCQSKSFVIHSVSPREKRPCSIPPETLEIKADDPDQLTINFNRPTTQMAIAPLLEPINITQENIESENTVSERICFAGMMMPRCIGLSDGNTLIYTDEMGGNSTLTVIFKRQNVYPQ